LRSKVRDVLLAPLLNAVFVDELRVKVSESIVRRRQIDQTNKLIKRFVLSRVDLVDIALIALRLEAVFGSVSLFLPSTRRSLHYILLLSIADHEFARLSLRSHDVVLAGGLTSTLQLRQLAMLVVGFGQLFLQLVQVAPFLKPD
jgi:hypothetical protein